MSDTVIIKKVERETIVLEKCFVGEFSPFYAIITFLLLFGVAYSMGITMNNIYGDPNNMLSSIPIFSLWMSIGLTGFLCFLGICSKPLPAYNVRILGQYDTDSSRLIVKTTPEKDQVDICRAAQELEIKARAISKKERELEQIAMKCK